MNEIKAQLEKELREAGWHSRGYIPHFDGRELPQFITDHLADSMPQSVLARWRQELAQKPPDESKIILHRRIERYLDQGYGNAWLKDHRIANMVQNSLLHFDGTRYKLSAWVVMPNHVHFLLTRAANEELSRILHSFKSYTSHEANKMLRRSGQFWFEEYFDRYIRDAKHFAATVRYIENNPVKAKL